MASAGCCRATVGSSACSNLAVTACSIRRRELTVEMFKVVRAELPTDRYAVIKAARPDLAAELFEFVETKANEVAMVSLDGRPMYHDRPWQARAYWKVATRVAVERIDVASDPKVSARVTSRCSSARVQRL